MVPINPREEEIEGQKCAKSLSDLPEPQDVSVSVVTPPGKRASCFRVKDVLPWNIFRHDKKLGVLWSLKVLCSESVSVRARP